MKLAPLPYHRIVLLALTCACIIAAPALAQLPPEPTIADAQIGFGGVYKLGCWTPLTIELHGGSQAYTGHVVVTVPDTDGVPTRVVSEPNHSIEITPEQTTRMRLYVRIGQAMSPVQVQFFSDDGNELAKRTFFAEPKARTGILPGGVPATNRLLLEFGPTLDLGEVVQDDGRTDEQLSTRIARIEQADDLPTRWYGYESIETVLLTTSEPERYRPLLQNREPIEALQKWVERGGRLVLFCAKGAEELLADDGVLASLAPGKYEKMERLTQAQPLASFSGSEQQITHDRRLDLGVPSLLDVQGQILASAGRSESNVPLVVRTRRGLGEIVFVGLDFDRAPLRDWAGRTSFLRRVLDWQERDKNKQTAESSDPEDLSGHLRNSLDKQFVGVQVVPFGLVALLVGVYILLIGPGDYLFVKRILRRTELTWLTFPLIVLGVSAAAYGIAIRMKGDQLRVNQIEIIDVDVSHRIFDNDNSNCFARGTVWTHFFTPQVSELNLRFQPSYLGQTKLADTENLVSWLGLPGYALGGMQASGSQTSVFDTGYQYGDGLSSMQRLPVQVWSTKTLTARWSAHVAVPLLFNLEQTGEELIRGQIGNHTGVELEDCMLLYGHWAYKLGRLPAGKTLDIDDSLHPRTVKTLLTSATAGDNSVTHTADDGTVLFKNAEWDVARLVKAMMFYQAINGPRYTNKQHRYQSFVDLSTILKQDNQAILLARCNAPGSQWLTGPDPSTSKPLASDQDRRWTYYRFVLKVESPESSD